MYDSLFSPLELNGVTISNRIVRTAHRTRLQGDDLIAYHEARARGGVGLTILEVAGVHPTSVTPSLPIFEDSVLDFYDRLLDRLDQYDMKLFQQLWHAGAAFHAPEGPGTPIWSASAVQSPLVANMPREMTTDMIDDVVEGFAAAAGRVKRAGLDGLEIHAGHGYLIAQFLSPALNRREDDYGGSFDNRTRFLRDVLTAVRSEVGPDFHVGIRISPDLVPEGFEADEVLELARILDGQVDHLNVSLGSEFRIHKTIDTMEAPLGYELPTSERITRSVSTPTIVSGRLMSLDDAHRVVESGAADMVSMVRALIADPELVAKSQSGNSHLVRPCTGTNLGCVGRVREVGRIGCVVNVAAGNESRVPFDPEDRVAVPKRVLVVGGGPAGMEAARTAALRGHDVTLHDMRRELGGQVSIAAAVPHRQDLAAITSWLEAELMRVGVTVKRGSFVDPDFVAEFGADHVILATGTEPMRDLPQATRPAGPVPGSHLPHVCTSWDVLGFGRRLPAAQSAVVFDDLGTFEAIGAALALVEAGVRVTFVSSLESIGARIPMPAATVAHARELLMRADFTFVPSSAVESISELEVVTTPLGTERRDVHSADLVVLVLPHHPNREVGDELVRAGVAFTTIGDMNGAQDLQIAIRQGAEAGRSI